jgi:hypothetical protein
MGRDKNKSSKPSRADRLKVEDDQNNLDIGRSDRNHLQQADEFGENQEI